MKETDLELLEAESILRQALSIQPSPALQARVKADALATRSPVGSAWWLGSAAAVVVLAIVLAGPRPRLAGPAPSRLSTLPAARAEAEHGEPGPKMAEALRTASLPDTAPGTRAVRGEGVPKRSLPSTEILVEPGQAQALVRFRELAQAGLVTFSAGRRDADLNAPLPPVASLRMEPLAIEPLRVPDVPELTPLARGDS